MCFTVDEMNQACGYLLLNEFSTFVYCCKRCHCEFSTGPDLEVHILCEHEDTKRNIQLNIDEVFVEDSDFESTSNHAPHIKTEPDLDTNDEEDLYDCLQDDESNTFDDLNGYNESVIQKRGPGRPRKYDVIAIDSSMPKRSRGRPRKICEFETSQQLPKRGRGRPRKIVENEPFAKIEKPVGQDGQKRGRGRPPGSKNKKPNVIHPVKIETAVPSGSGERVVGPNSDESADDSDTDFYIPQIKDWFTKRPRGRPLGSKNKKKKKKHIQANGITTFKMETELIGGEYEEPRNGIKRQRGRPPGSKNKVKQINETDAFSWGMYSE